MSDCGVESTFSRTERLIGAEALKMLQNSSVAVFGAGGVGGYVIEALARSGVGKLTIIDNDVVAKSNLNRQILALNSTLEKKKTEIARARVLDINPDIEVEVFDLFYLPETADQIDLSKYDYIVDAIDTVSAKIELVLRANELSVPIISCMGTGNKLDPKRLEIDDIYNTSVCPLARVMRRELKERGISSLKVLYSKEEPMKNQVPGSTAFVPPTAGLIIASEVVADLIKER